MMNNSLINNSDFSTIEDKLSSFLRPIQPDPQFISHLQSRLVRRSEITLDTRNRGLVLVVLAAGLFIGGLLFYVYRKLT